MITIDEKSKKRLDYAKWPTDKILLMMMIVEICGNDLIDFKDYLST